MKRSFVRSLSVLLAALMIFSSFPSTAFAYGSSSRFDYSVENVMGTDYAILTSYTGNEETVEIPKTIGGYPVIALGAEIFSGKANIKNITIPEGIEAIYTRAFYDMREAVSISLPSTLKYIGKEAFASTGILQLNFPEGLEAIDTSAFNNTYFYKTVQDIVLPDSLKYIGNSAFYASTIRSVSIGKNATFSNAISYNPAIGVTASSWWSYKSDEFSNPFERCVYCKTITVSPDNPYITSVDNVIYSKDLEDLISYHGYDVEYYEDNALDSQLPYYDELSFEIPNTVKTIIPTAFSGFMVNTLTISNSVEEIMDRGFASGLGKIGNIVFEDGSNLKTIGKFAFSGSIGGSIEIPGSVEEIGFKAFYGFGGNEILFETPSSLKYIDAYAFANCKNLTEITIPASVVELGRTSSYLYSEYYSNAFSGCTSLHTVRFESGSQIKTIYEKTFYNDTDLSKIVFGNGCALTSFEDTLSGAAIEELDFSGCSNLNYISRIDFDSLKQLRSVNLLNTDFVRIPEGMFKNCYSLEKVILPQSVQLIYDYAFQNCSALKEIDLSYVRVIEPNAFDGCDLLDTSGIKDKFLKITDDALFSYGTSNGKATVFSYLGEDDDVVFPDKIDGCVVTDIDENCFDSVRDIITTVTLPGGLENLRGELFRDMVNLKAVNNFENTVVDSISDNCFYNCNNLETIKLPDTVKTIGDYAFYRCSKLKEISLPEGLVTVNGGAFAECSSLTEVVLPDSLENLGVCFSDCFNLKSLTVGSKITGIDDILKNNSVDSLEEINISADNPLLTSADGVVYNKDQTEILCYPMGKKDKSFTPLQTVVSFGDSSFKGNRFIEHIELSANIKNIGHSAFYETGLKSVYLPSSIETVGNYAFSRSALEKAEFAKDFCVDTLYDTFASCINLKEMIIPETARIENIYSVCNMCRNLEIVTLPDSLKVIGNSAFDSTSLSSVRIPENVVEIGSYAFRNTALKTLVLNGNVKNIGIRAFNGCSDLMSADISGAQYLDSYAFAYCVNLTNIDLTGLIYMENNAFEGCANLNKLYFINENMQNALINESEFESNSTIETIVVGNSVTEIKDRAFADCASLTTALIADSVTNISDTAFENCNNLNIVCEEGSYAMNYARRNSIPYTTFVVAPIPDQEYTGKEITPDLDVTAQSRKLSAGSDYTAVYSDNINVGTAKVNVIGVGDYSIFASLVKFNIVSGETQNGSSSAPEPPQQESGNGQGNNNSENQSGSVTESNNGNLNSSKSPDSYSSKPNSNGGFDPAQSVSGYTSHDSETESNISSDNENQTGGENRNQNSNAENSDSQHSTQPDSNEDSDNNEEDDMKWYEVIFAAIKSFFNKIIEFFKSLFS